MKSLHPLPQLNLDHITIANNPDSLYTTNKFNPYSARYRRVIEGSQSSSSPIRLRGIDISPEKQVPFFTAKKGNMKRKGSTGYEYYLDSKYQNIQQQRTQYGINQLNLFKPHEHIKQEIPISRVKIIPDGCTSPTKQKNYQQQPTSPFLKKARPLQEPRFLQEIKSDQSPNNSTKQSLDNKNTLSDLIAHKHPFFNCTLTQSYVDPSTKANFVIQQSVIFQRSILESFLILSKTEVKSNNYCEMIAIEKDIGLAVSLKSINCSSPQISNEIKILKIIGDNSVHVIKHFNGVVDKNDYIFIRQYYEILLRDMIDKLNEQSIKELCRQMLSVFEYFTSIKLIYKGNFLTNVCYHGGLYKLRNFQFCNIKKQTSQSSLRRKYLGVLREMMKVVLAIDAVKPCYSKRLKRDLKPTTIVFMNDLVKNGMGFKQLKQHAFLNC